MRSPLELLAILLVGSLCSGPLAAEHLPLPESLPRVTAISPEVREKFKLDPFYEKQTDYKGYLILSSKKVPDEALLEARYLISQMLAGRDDIVEALVKANCRFTVMAPDEMTTDVPEQRNMTPKDYWDRRARGLGGKITSCGAENLLNLRGDRYRNENILIHEFSHCIHQRGLRSVDPTFDRRLRESYQKAIDQGLWADTYAAENPSEYWAEGVQIYFDCQAPKGGVHNDIDRREKLELYDPELFKLIDEVFRQSAFRYVRYDQRQRASQQLQSQPSRD